MARPHNIGSFVVSVLALMTLVGCGKSPAAPCTDCRPVEQLAFVQHPDIQMDNVRGGSMQVTYTIPTTTGGATPITVTCSPASGSPFPVGMTIVKCQATDGAGRTAETQFRVVLVPFVPVLQVTTFLAVGDSLTLGENGDNSQLDHCTSSSSTFGVRPQFVDTCHTYPFLLGQKLVNTYTSQTPTVFVDALRGRTSSQVLNRLPADVNTYRPEALLLLAGINDVVDDPGGAISNLRGCIQVARAFGVKEVFLSNMLPTFNSALEPLLPAFNNQIRALAAAEHVVLVDNFAALMAVGDYRTLINPADVNHLHLTPAGYQIVADTFLAAIKTRFEVSAQSLLNRLRR